MFDQKMNLSVTDPQLWAAMQNEAQRQEEHVELIASENYTSPAVMQAQGSVLTNKYAEGYPSKRYYGGCEFVDVAEQLAIDRAKHCLVQIMPMFSRILVHKPTRRYIMALLQAGDTILGMSLAHGGHLTHGAKSIFWKLYNSYNTV